jgi:hypothetical protein
MEILKKIINYFDAKVVGSYLLVQVNLLTINDINDIDLCIEPKLLNNVRNFLLDEGFVETSPPHQFRGYEQVEGSGLFTKEGQKSIHILTESNVEVYTIPVLISKKFERSNVSDIEQLKKVIENKMKSLSNTSDKK